MKVIGIGGSPRKGGNTDILLDAALEGARSAGAVTEKIILNDLNFKPCQECGGCDETGICVIDDDMQPIYKKIERADALIIASPIFFGNLSAQLKMMIDRFQCFWIRKYILKKGRALNKRRKGIFLCVGAAHQKNFFENAKNIIKIFFTTLDIEYFGDLFYGGVDKKGAISEKEEVLNNAFNLGRALCKSHIRR